MEARKVVRPHRPGKKRHYVPQSLSKGFRGSGARKGQFLVCEVGKAPKWKGPGAWGWEPWGYRAGDLDVDAGWTASESRDGRWLSQLRKNVREGRRVQDVVSMVTCLAVRTKQAQRYILDQVRRCNEAYGEETAKDPDGTALLRQMKWGLRNRKGYPEAEDFHARLCALYREHWPGEPMDERVAEMLDLVAAAGGGARWREHAAHVRRSEAETWQGAQGEELAQKAGLRWLRNVQQGLVLDKYRGPGLTWRMLEYSKGALVLGDGVVVERREGGGGRGYRVFERDDLELWSVCLPIGPCLLVEGTRDPAEKPDPEWVSEQGARICLESFIASEHTRRVEELHRLAGTTEEDPSDAGRQRELLRASLEEFLARGEMPKR